MAGEATRASGRGRRGTKVRRHRGHSPDTATGHPTPEKARFGVLFQLSLPLRASEVAFGSEACFASVLANFTSLWRKPLLHIGSSRYFTKNKDNLSLLTAKTIDITHFLLNSIRQLNSYHNTYLRWIQFVFPAVGY